MADLRSIVLDLCRRAGIEADADPAALAGRVPGMALSSRSTVRAVLETLRQAYPFDAVESEGRIVFRPRGRPPVATVTAADLVQDGEGVLVQVTRRQETELPRQVDVVYAALSAAHQAATQSACRMAGAARGALTVDLPLVLGDDQARRIAERLLRDAWIERDVHIFKLSAAHARLEPGDVIDLDLRGRVRRLRVTATETTAALVEVSAVPDSGETWVSASPGGVPHVRRSVARKPAASVLFALDVPLLRDADDGPGWYAAASHDAGVPGTVWRGALLMASHDGGAGYAPLATLDSPAVWGRCESVLPAGPTTHWDEASTLRLRLRNGQLESRAAAAVLHGANAALVGREIVQYRRAVLQPDGAYVLSGLLRGRRGTEHQAAAHGADETFLLLRAEDLRRIRTGQESLGAEMRLKAVTLGTHAEDAAEQVFIHTGMGLKPWSVAHVRGRRDAASGDWTVTWVRRSRLGAGWIDHADVALAEESERYEVDILSAEGARLRTLAADQPAVTYPAAAQIGDFGAPQHGLRLRVHQISATIGRGVGRDATV